MRCHCCSNGIFCVSTVHIKDSTPGSTVPAVNETTQLMPSRTGKSYIDTVMGSRLMHVVHLLACVWLWLCFTGCLEYDVVVMTRLTTGNNVSCLTWPVNDLFSGVVRKLPLDPRVRLQTRLRATVVTTSSVCVMFARWVDAVKQSHVRIALRIMLELILTNRS